MRPDSEYMLGIDLGTSECKACLVSHDGEIAASARYPYPTHCPAPAWAEQEPDDWLAAVRAVTGKVLATTGLPPSRIAGLSFSSAAHIGVLLDQHNRPVRRAILWNDQRSAEEAAWLARRHSTEILSLTYQGVSTTWLLPHLLWLRAKEPENWARVRRLMLSKDYVIERLTGHALTDPATAVSSLLYDAISGQWSSDLCALAGISPESLPEVRPATTVAGRLTEAAAAPLGLLSGTPIVLGTLDSAAEMYGAGALRSGNCVLRLATAGGLQLVVSRPQPDPRLITYPHPLAPLWYCQAGTNSCASAVRWASQALTGGQTVNYEQWDEWAAAVPPGCGGLLFHPYLMGERAPYWDPGLRASFVGITIQHGPGHFARAVYEGAAFSVRDAFSVLTDLGVSDDPLTALGGGALSRLWVQIMADVLGRSLLVAPGIDSSYGAALLGLVGLGMVAEPHAVAITRWGSGTAIAPIPENQALYDRLFGAYLRVHNQLAPLYATEWRA